MGKALDLRIEPLQKFDAMVARQVAAGVPANEVLHKMLGPGGGRPSPELIAQMRALEAKGAA